jgi:hypothetical protein
MGLRPLGPESFNSGVCKVVFVTRSNSLETLSQRAFQGFFIRQKSSGIVRFHRFLVINFTPLFSSPRSRLAQPGNPLKGG